MIVLKFGGTSVESAENISKVIDIVKRIAEKDSCAVVVSALGGVTDKLLEAAKKAVNKDDSYCQILEELKNRHLAVLNVLIANNKNALAFIEAKFESLQK